MIPLDWEMTEPYNPKIESITFSDLPQFAMEELDRARRELAEVPDPTLFNFLIDDSHLNFEGQNSKALFAELSAAVPNGRNVVYIIKPVDEGSTAIGLIRTLFEESKKSKDGRSRDNRRLSPCLYVSSSSKMATRMKEHLGSGSRLTYALKLLEWLPMDDFPIQLTCALYPLGTPATVIRALEDALWDRLQPMFGRKGPR